MPSDPIDMIFDKLGLLPVEVLKISNFEWVSLEANEAYSGKHEAVFCR